MNQDQIIHELIGLQDEMIATSPEDAMIKRAKEQDWSVEILGRVAKVYNTAKTADHLSKSASRSDNFGLIDVEQLQSDFLEFDTPEAETFTKAASPTHSADIDLTREMEKAAGFAVCPPIPEEHRADESILEKKASAEINDPYDGLGRPEFIQQAKNEAAIACEAYNNQARDYLLGLDKSSGYSKVIDVSNDELISRHHFKSAAVDAVIESLQGHADLMHKEIKTLDEFNKSAFARSFDSPMDDLVKSYGEASTLLSWVQNMESGLEPEAAMDKVAGTFSGVEEDEEKKDEGNVATKPQSKEKDELQKGFDSIIGGEGKIESQPAPEEEEEQSENKEEPKSEKGITPSPHMGLGDVGGRAKQLAKDTYDTTKQVGSDTASLIGSLLGAGAAGGERRINSLVDTLGKVESEGPGVHADQAAVDREVNDSTRAIGVQRMINTDPILSQAKPDQVLRMYNMLARRNPDLADDPEAMRMALREAVSLGGAPVENLKTISQV